MARKQRKGAAVAVIAGLGVMVALVAGAGGGKPKEPPPEPEPQPEPDQNWGGGGSADDATFPSEHRALLLKIEDLLQCPGFAAYLVNVAYNESRYNPLAHNTSDKAVFAVQCGFKKRVEKWNWPAPMVGYRTVDLWNGDDCDPAKNPGPDSCSDDMICSEEGFVRGWFDSGAMGWFQTIGSTAAYIGEKEDFTPALAYGVELVFSPRFQVWAAAYIAHRALVAYDSTTWLDLRMVHALPGAKLKPLEYPTTVEKVTKKWAAVQQLTGIDMSKYPPPTNMVWPGAEVLWNALEVV